jgi:hypothetical protein
MNPAVAAYRYPTRGIPVPHPVPLAFYQAGSTGTTQPIRGGDSMNAQAQAAITVKKVRIRDQRTSRYKWWVLPSAKA